MSEIQVGQINSTDGSTAITTGAGGTVTLSAALTAGGALAMGANNISFSNGNGIDFSASEGSGASSSVLHDYEEGTFSPYLADNDSGGNVSSTTAQEAQYTKIGRLVYINIRLSNISTAGMSSGNDFFVVGLPFSSRSSSGTGYPGTIWMQSNTYSGQIVPRLTDGVNYFRFSEIISNAPQDFLTVGEIGNGTGDFEINMWYETDA